LWALGHNKHENPHLQNAWNKYGEENFIFEILEEVRGGRKELLVTEQDYLNEWFPTGMLYNMARKADAPLEKPLGYWEVHNGPFTGKKHSRETKQTQSKKHIEWHRTHESPRPWLGKHFTQEHKDKQSKANTGNEYGAKPYPAFYNTKTGESILAGVNLSKICQERQLNYAVMWNLKTGHTKQTKTGWCLTTKNEIEHSM